jgi:hypothetical protein
MSITLSHRLNAFSELPDEAVLSVKEITMLSGAKPDELMARCQGRQAC